MAATILTIMCRTWVARLSNAAMAVMAIGKKFWFSRGITCTFALPLLHKDNTRHALQIPEWRWLERNSTFHLFSTSIVTYLDLGTTHCAWRPVSQHMRTTGKSILSPSLFLLVIDPLLRQLQSHSLGISVNKPSTLQAKRFSQREGQGGSGHTQRLCAILQAVSQSESLWPGFESYPTTIQQERAHHLLSWPDSICP